ETGVEFISGVTVRFTLDMGGLGNGGEGSVRLVFIGAGRGLATVSLMATEVPGMTAPVDPQSIDLTKTVEAAAEKLVKVLEDR
ncbi:MAG: hypothetical protein N2037_06000, partial [Acidimicrobiales bacterium]|nr:hypothetical protein [Acidimicrobiales bacterium]